MNKHTSCIYDDMIYSSNQIYCGITDTETSLLLFHLADYCSMRCKLQTLVSIAAGKPITLQLQIMHLISVIDFKQLGQSYSSDYNESLLLHFSLSNYLERRKKKISLQICPYQTDMPTQSDLAFSIILNGSSCMPGYMTLFLTWA